VGGVLRAVGHGGARFVRGAGDGHRCHRAGDRQDRRQGRARYAGRATRLYPRGDQHFPGAGGAGGSYQRPRRGADRARRGRADRAERAARAGGVGCLAPRRRCAGATRGPASRSRHAHRRGADESDAADPSAGRQCPAGAVQLGADPRRGRTDHRRRAGVARYQRVAARPGGVARQRGAAAGRPAASTGGDLHRRGAGRTPDVQEQAGRRGSWPPQLGSDGGAGDAAGLGRPCRRIALRPARISQPARALRRRDGAGGADDLCARRRPHDQPRDVCGAGPRRGGRDRRGGGRGAGCYRAQARRGTAARERGAAACGAGGWRPWHMGGRSAHQHQSRWR
jgi:hypothetical protein